MTPLVIIPARYGSSRLPGKPLVPITSRGGVSRPLIEWSWRAAVAAVGEDAVIVATDDDRIAALVSGFGGRSVMTSPDLRNGTERCAAAVRQLGLTPDVVVDFQGDNPLVPAAHVAALIGAFERPDVAVATPYITCDAALAGLILGEHAAGRVGGTCVVIRQDGKAAYFSKWPIPHGANPAIPLKLHIGLYAYSRSALEAYAAMPASPLELAEGLEQLRFLDAGWPIEMIAVEAPPQGIWEVNNPQDVALVAQRLTD